MYGEEDGEEKAKEKKHMTMYEAANLAKEAGVKEMWLTHFSPSLNKPSEYADKVKEIFPAAVIPKDRYVKILNFEDEEE